MLAHVGGDDRVDGKRFAEEATEVDGMQGVLGPWRDDERIFGAEGGGAGEPGGAGGLGGGQTGEEAAEDVGGVAGEADEGVFDFADLGAINVDVRNGGVGTELGDFAGGA